jgi:hypothetical protein
MDKDVLKRQLTERCQQALDEALKAVDDAPDGQWIAASEWEVRDIFQKLTADCFGQIVQNGMDGLPSSSQTAFSPGGRGVRITRQGCAPSSGIDGRRRD